MDPSTDREPFRPIPDTPPTRHRRVGSPLAALAVLAGCSSSGATGQPPAPAATAVAPSEPVSRRRRSSPRSPSVSAGASVGTTPDGAGDVTPAYLDIVSFARHRRQRVADPGVGPGGRRPRGLAGGRTAGLPVLHRRERRRSVDYTAALKLVPEGGFRPSLVGRGSTPPLEGAAYPGTANLAGSTISLTLRLDAIGCPRASGYARPRSRPRPARRPATRSPMRPTPGSRSRPDASLWIFRTLPPLATPRAAPRPPAIEG